MKFSIMLKGIRSQFKPQGGGRYVCNSLFLKYGPDSRPLINFISEQLGVCPLGTKITTVDGWLYQHHNNFYWKNSMYNNMKAYRLAWIDQMIEMFEAGGN